ncbi:ABC transporter substrate-binding protein [Pseudonocardia kujensis]|uniref:ABC transporter substrate-binding protein n=1 Tax=Pseudonocardia kujensis TaxID=1128675 RepID=UPI001E325DEB|nr:ABC transporter substrate-binding protein [Pseudonocardia kujensis]MCE0768014.1 ABC transporter substrate-binding protein [Pseudonocardia kujensis]
MSHVPRSGRRAGRTALRALAAAALTALVAAACSGPSQAPSTSAPEPSAAAQHAFPVTLKHAYGETTIPAAPTRVVTIGFNEGDFALALGVVPLAEREFFGGFDWQDRPWAAGAKHGAQPVALSSSELPLETIAGLEPDLILGVYSFIDQPTYERLSAIAPTVAQPTANGEGAAATWQEQTRITGQALGRTDRAEQLITETEQKLEDAAAPSFAGRTLAMDFMVDGTPYKLGTDDLRAQLFTGLGFTVPASTETLSPETLGPLDQDVIVSMGRTQEQYDSPVLHDLNAVKQGRIVNMGGYTTPFAGALGYSSPLSLPYAADQVAPKLAEVLG